MDEIRGTSVLILGYGREGKSVFSWMQKHYPTLTIEIADIRTEGDQYLRRLHQFDTVIRSPGVSPYLPEIASYVASGGYITTATNIFFAQVKGKTIGITGTKGKSTTSSLIAHILSCEYTDVRLAGNIGTPMLDMLDGSTKNTVFVLELSSHQLVDIRYSPHIAVLLKIVPEHLDYYPDMASYIRAKENIFRFQKKGDYLVRNEKIPTEYASKLLGNAENIAAAVKVGRLMHISEACIHKQLASFSPLPHRLEFVGEFRGIQFYNDSLATIPQATIHALDALGSKGTTLIAGGFDRNIDFAILGTYLRNHPVHTLILFPDTGEKILKSIPHQSTRIPHYFVHTMEEAVKCAYEHTRSGAICVLSPASASYNLFRDYVDRGDQFKMWVRKLA